MNGIKLTLGHAMPATSALVGVNQVRMPQVSHDSAARAIALAGTATTTFFRINLVGEHRQELLAANLIDVVMEHGIH